ncbi:membrane dipeptidase-domain-containing protein [Mycena rebaudengoi]|nr:membrane dipeptidase-domain-containing protein [Mycena rebaudengoi]
MSPSRSRSGSRSRSRSSSPPRQQHSRDTLKRAILGLGRTYLSTQRIEDNDDSHTGTANEASSLLPHLHHQKDPNVNLKTRAAVWTGLTIMSGAALIVLLFFQHLLPDALAPIVALGGLPRDPARAALRILDRAPVIDGHIDLPILLRAKYANNVSAVDLTREFIGHVDIPRLRKGKVGGFFWSVYVGCADPEAEGKDFLESTWRVRDTLEQIDVARLTIEKYPDVFQLALGPADIRDAINKGKIASLLGVEGGHQLGNSLAVLRQYHALGARYMTLTHTCHNAFADSCGLYPGIIPLHGGLSPLGRTLIQEMNRLGVLVDLSHTSDATARQALALTKAPVIWSHSSARAVHDVPRNVPDDVLRLVGMGKGQTDGVVMVNFVPQFVAAPGNATVKTVADHVEHIAAIAGKKHVGIGSDYDGIETTPTGLEDVSKYPALIAELYARGWDKYELSGLAGANLLRVFDGAERVARELRAGGAAPAFELYEKRRDIPVDL